ncbi:MAG: hypothetical protein ABSB75_00695 [Candidatus Limnocylindrales bacterium]
MRKSTLLVAVVGAAACIYLYRRSRLPPERRDLVARRAMNERIAPILLRHGAADGERTGIGIVEHVGRVSGVARRTLVHPIPLGDRFAILLAYGERGQWPRNVIAAGCCRLQFHDSVYSLSIPRVMDGAQVEGLPKAEEVIGRAVGGRFLLMDVESVVPGRL